MQSGGMVAGVIHMAPRCYEPRALQRVFGDYQRRAGNIFGFVECTYDRMDVIILMALSSSRLMCLLFMTFNSPSWDRQRVYGTALDSSC